MWVNENSHEIKIVFSGDIGKANQLILKDPARSSTPTTCLWSPPTATVYISPWRRARRN
jgi:hypothetical protein